MIYIDTDLAQLLDVWTFDNVYRDVDRQNPVVFVLDGFVVLAGGHIKLLIIIWGNFCLVTAI